MKPVFAKPSPIVGKLVNSYLFLRKEAYEPEFDGRFIPNGFAAIIFLFPFEGTTVVIDQKEKLPGFFLVVPKIKPVLLTIPFAAEAMVVLCKASVLSSLFDIKLNISTEYSHLFTDLFKGFPMYENLKKITSDKEKVAYFEDILLNSFPIKEYQPDEIDEIYDHLCESNGEVMINNIVQSMESKYRSFRRNFQTRVGISMKGFARIIRVNYLYRIMSKNKTIDIQSVVYLGNYYDQSHLIHDFEKIVGETPRQLFMRNQENTKLLSGVNL